MAMTCCDGERSGASIEIFSHAREFYHSELSELGVSVEEISEVAMPETKTHLLIYRG